METANKKTRVRVEVVRGAIFQTRLSLKKAGSRYGAVKWFVEIYNMIQSFQFITK